NWLKWVQAHAGAERETRMELGNANYPPMEAAPGTYVHVR
ncbi:poly(3-hydroxyalkanoic acid) synthase 2, partial [Pseudomonas syringae pv. actinidiae ICMP 18804]